MHHKENNSPLPGQATERPKKEKPAIAEKTRRKYAKTTTVPKKEKLQDKADHDRKKHGEERQTVYAK